MSDAKILSFQEDALTGFLEPKPLLLLYGLTALAWLCCGLYTSAAIHQYSILEWQPLLVMLLLPLLLGGMGLRLWLGQSVSPAQDGVDAYRVRFRLAALLACLLLVPIFFVIVVAVRVPQIERQHLEALESVAVLKAEQIESWLTERDGDAHVVGASIQLAQLLDTWQKKRDHIAYGEAMQQLSAVADSYGYESVFVVNQNGRTLMGYGEHQELNADGKRALDIALSAGQSVRGELFLASGTQAPQVYLDWLVPIRMHVLQMVPDTAIVLRTRLNDQLFSQIQRWPVPSDSAETLLVRKEGDEMVFLNELRFRSNTAMRLALPANRADLPAAIAAASEQPGITHGRDYRQHKVMAAFRPVNTTDWQVVAKLDRSEAMQGLWALMAWLLLTALLGTVAVAALLTRLRQQQRETYRIQSCMREVESDRLLNKFFELPFVGMAIFANTEQWHLIRFNDQLCTLFGFSREQMAGKSLLALTHPDDMEFTLAEYRRVLCGDQDGYSIEKRYVRADGSTLYAHADVQAVRNEAGEIAYLVATVRDIGERRELINSIREGEHFLKEAQKIANLGSWRYDLESGVLRWSDEVFSIVEKDPQTYQPSYETFFELVHPDDRGTLNDTYKNSVRDRLPFEMVHRLLLPDGRIKFLHQKCITHYDAQGKPKRSLGVVQDITEQKQREERLLTLMQAVEQSTNTIVITDLQAHIQYANPSFERTTGYKIKEALGRNPSILQSGRTPSAAYAEMWRKLTQGEPWSGELHNRRKDGTEYLEFAHISPVRSPDGTITHYLAIKEDVTELKASQQALRQLNQELEVKVEERTAELVQSKQDAEQASRAKSAFLANMSHEIRTPMNAIIGLAHVLARGALTAGQREQLRKIDTAANHLLSVINDILDLSKIEAGHLNLEHADFSLGILLDNIYSIVAEQARQKGLIVEVDSDSTPLWLHGDATRLRQAILNYVGNAIKFTDSGSIILRAYPVEQVPDRVKIRFEVEDTGIGISPEQQVRLFQAFEQADASTTRKYGGTGLGLAINKYLATMMDGEVGFQSVTGQGSTFWFTAWLDLGHTPEHGDTPHPEHELEDRLRAHAGARVLLTDDLELNREVAALLLQDSGLIIDMAEDGAQAVALAREHRYALILMDMQMPVMDGLEATRQIRNLPGVADVPVIAMTANAFVEDRRACIEAGMVDFVAKPIMPERFYAVLLKWLDKFHPSLPPPVLVAEPELAIAGAPGDVPAISLPGLDVVQGLKVWRNAEVYRKFLRKFAEDYRAVADNIDAMLVGHDAPAAGALAHKLKGAAGNLALKDVAQVAAAIDHQVKQGESPRALVADLARAMQTALAAIDSYAPLPVAVAAAGSAAAPPLQLLMLLQRLLEILDQDTPEGSESVLQGLAALLPAERLTLLRRLVDEFDFRAAEAVVRQIAEEQEVALE